MKKEIALARPRCERYVVHRHITLIAPPSHRHDLNHESGNGVDGYTLVLPPRALVSVPEPAVRQTEAGVAGPDREGSHVVPVHVVREGKTPVLES